MALAEITVLPTGTPSASVSTYVAAAVRVLQDEGIEYQLTPMGTIVDGDVDTLLQMAKQMHEAVFAQGVERVSTLIRIDERRDKVLTMQGKVASVRQKLRR
jgi:uncharacterized protein (TIGR00106 family)